MRVKLTLLVATAALLAGCTGPPPSEEQRAATDLNPSGRPIQGPELYQHLPPPNTTNAFDPLYCRFAGPGTVCTRS